MEVIIFGSVQFYQKKVTKSKFFFEKQKPKPVQTDWFRFGLIFLDKTGSNRLGSVFRFDSIFSVCLGFLRFFCPPLIKNHIYNDLKLIH